MSLPNVIITQNNNDALKFTLNGSNVSVANALRRTIISDIPVVVFDPDTIEIEKNSSRFNNEIVKHRLGCIPIHIDDMNAPIDKFKVEIKKNNDQDTILFVTTNDFKVFVNDKEVSEDSRKKIFPHDSYTHEYILFLRLRPRISNEMKGEELNMSSKLMISTAKENSMYNVVSTCAYGNTPDPVAIKNAWNIKKKELQAEGLSKTDIEYEQKNWYILDSKRHFVEDSFDFTIETVGIYTNEKIVLIASAILVKKLQKLIDIVGDISIKPSDTTIPYSFDITLENEDYTIGKLIEYYLYEHYYNGNNGITFVGFLKTHPHYKFSIIRVALREQGDSDEIRRYFVNACKFGIAALESIGSHFS